MRRGPSEAGAPSDALSQIVVAAPNVPGYGGGKWAMYAVGCCWWTSDPADLGRSGSGLPACPHCHSVLMQAPLEDFVANARKASHFGSRGVDTFAAAHASPCRASWDEYDA